MNLAGKLIGSYRIENEIGRGGMATIYRAIDVRSNQSVAVKILLPQYVSDPITLRRFRQEGENSKKLRHPNIIKVFESGNAEGLHYIAMEYASRGTLAQMLKQKGQTLAVEEAVPILRRVAAALDYAHSRNILHRDVKPSNILIGDNGQILLSDFGVARQIASDATVVTTVGFSVGTPAYMSPEQAQGDYDLTPRSDIYSLGVVAYAMLTAALPFDAESQLALLRKIIDDSPKSPDLHNPKLPTGVSYALQRVLAKAPEGRYATANEFVDALEKGISWQPSAHDWSTLARAAVRSPIPSGPTYSEPPQRHNVAGSLALLLGLLAVLLAALALFRPNVSRLLTSLGVPVSITSAVLGTSAPITESPPITANVQPNVASEIATLIPAKTPTSIPATVTFTPLPSATSTLELPTLTPTVLIVPLILMPVEDQTLNLQINVPQNWRQSHLGSALYFESPDHSSLFFVDRLMSTTPLGGPEEAIAAYLANVNTPFSTMELVNKNQIAKDGLTIWQQTYNAILIGGAQSTVRLSLLEHQDRYYLLGYSVASSNLDTFESIFNTILNELTFLAEPTATSTSSATTTPTLTATKTITPKPSVINTATTESPTVNTSETDSPAIAVAPTLIPIPTMDASATPHPSETATQQPPATFTSNPTETATLVPTSTPLPTATNSSTPTIEETPTSTFTLLPTSTPVPTTTETSTPTTTNTPNPTSTPVPTTTPSNTPNLPATDQAQLDRIATGVAETLTAMPTHTPLLPTATDTGTATFTLTPTSTSVLPRTNTLTPQPTATDLPSPTATPQGDSLSELYATLSAIDATLTALAPLLTPTVALVTATAVPTHTALSTLIDTAVPIPIPLATAALNAPTTAQQTDLITGFETFGSWQRGNEPYGIVYDIADGALLARYANHRQPDYGKCGVLVANRDGGGTNDIVRIFADGSIREVTSNTEDSWPQWSPSCQSVAYTSSKLGGSSLVYWQVDASDRFDAPPLKYNKGDLRGRYAVYLDNWRIAYNGCNYWASSSNCGIYTTDTKGGEPNRASDHSDDIPLDSMGSRILFHARRSGNWDVWAVNFDGSGLQQLTNSPANDGLATASPDFQHIVFLSNRDGNWAIYTNALH